MIESWGFQEDIKDVKDIMNIVDDNNNKVNYSDVKIENFIIKLTQYLSSWT